MVRVRSSEKNRATGPRPCAMARLVQRWPPERRPPLRIPSPMRSVTPFAPLVSPARTWGAKGWRRLARDKVPTLGITSQSRPDKFSANPLGNCCGSPNHQSQRIRCQVAQRLDFSLKNLVWTRRMESSVAAFSNPKIRWALKDFSNPERPWLWAHHLCGRSKCVPAAERPPVRPGLGAGSRAVPGPPAPRFLENRVSALLISAPF